MVAECKKIGMKPVCYASSYGCSTDKDALYLGNNHEFGYVYYRK